MSNQELDTHLSEFEAEELRGGELPNRIAMGAWRALQPGETVDPRHIQDIRGVMSIPARLYGNPQMTSEPFCPTEAAGTGETQPIQLEVNLPAFAR